MKSQKPMVALAFCPQVRPLCGLLRGRVATVPLRHRKSPCGHRVPSCRNRSGYTTKSKVNPPVENRAGERRVVASDPTPPTNARSAGVFSAYGKVVGFGLWHTQGGRNWQIPRKQRLSTVHLMGGHDKYIRKKEELQHEKQQGTHRHLALSPNDGAH